MQSASTAFRPADPETGSRAPGSGRASRPGKWFAGALLIALVFLALVDLPRFVTYDGHDAGSQAALEYWLKNGSQFGKDVIQNVGPLGFLTYPGIFTGFLDVEKLVLNTMLMLSLSWLIVDVAIRRMPRPVGIAFLVCVLVFPTTNNSLLYLLALLTSHRVLQEVTPSSRFIWILLLAVLMLTKGSYFFIGLATMIAGAATDLGDGERRRAVRTGTLYCACLLSVWLLSGQPLLNIPAFIVSTFSFADGYNYAMAIYERVETTIAGFFALAFAATAIGMRVAGTPANRWNMGLWATGLVEGFILFVAWKHGFVRSDGHVKIFFHFCAIASMLLIWGSSGIRRHPHGQAEGTSFRRHVVGLTLQGGILLACMAGLYVSEKTEPGAYVRTKFAHFSSNVAAFADIRRHFDELDARLAKSAESLRLGNVASLVNGRDIGYFGMMPAVMLYNGFHYVTPPSTISFASWNEFIMKRDEAYFRDDRSAPGYLLLALQTIDGRLVAQDSPLAQMEIFRNYTPVTAEAGNILLRRTANRPPLSRGPIAAEESRDVGDWIDVPQFDDSPLWVRISMQENPLARLAAVLYKPPNSYRLSYYMTDGEIRRYRFMPRMAQVGFMINPVIADNSELLATYSAASSGKQPTGQESIAKRVKKIQVECERVRVTCDATLRVEFSRIDGLQLGTVSDDAIRKIRAKNFGFDGELIEVSVPHPVEKRNDFGLQLQQFHAPSRIVMHKQDGNRTVSGRYGMFSSAYDPGAGGDGVLVRIQFKAESDAEPRVLWEKPLDPFANLADRGVKSFSLPLPAEAGTVSITIDPKANAAWDQVFIDGLAIR